MTTAMLATEATFWLPVQASTFADSHDGLFYFIYYLCVFFFVAIMGVDGLLRRTSTGAAPRATSPARSGETTASSSSGAPSRRCCSWSSSPGASPATWTWSVPPSNALNVQVTGQKWSWAFTYPSGRNQHRARRARGRAGAAHHALGRRPAQLLRAGVPHQARRAAQPVHRALVPERTCRAPTRCTAPSTAGPTTPACSRPCAS
jgi:heme/copper-type cytochrome/quinol oxidase subunit 2